MAEVPYKCQLLHGPYKAPGLRRGDRAVCLVRDCDVIVTSWSDARISWPRCRGADLTTHGGVSLLVDEELARAIQIEAAAAIGYWWGVTGATIARWRKALGVTRTNNPRSHHLISLSSAIGAQAMEEREFTEEERERRRVLNRELGLSQYLKLAYEARRWTQSEKDMLAHFTDLEVARAIGKSEAAVRRMRDRLGLPNPVSSQSAPGDIAKQGEDSD